MRVLIPVSCHSWPRRVAEALESAVIQGGDVAAFVDQGPHRAAFEEIADEFPMVTWLTIESTGAASSRNAAFSFAVGHGYDFVLPLDDDDLLLSDALDVMVTFQSVASADIVYGDFFWFGPGQLQPMTCPSFSWERLQTRPFILSSSLISTKVWEAVRERNGHGYDPHMDELGGWEDYLFYVEAALEGFEFAHLNQPVLGWRQHGDSRTREANQNVPALVAYMREKTGCKHLYPGV